MENLSNWKRIVEGITAPEYPQLEMTRFNALIKSSSLRSVSDGLSEARYGLFTYGLYTIIFSSIFNEVSSVHLIPTACLSDWSLENPEVGSIMTVEESMVILPDVMEEIENTLLGIR